MRRPDDDHPLLLRFAEALGFWALVMAWWGGHCLDPGLAAIRNVRSALPLLWPAGLFLLLVAQGRLQRPTGFRVGKFILPGLFLAVLVGLLPRSWSTLHLFLLLAGLALAPLARQLRLEGLGRFFTAWILVGAATSAADAVARAMIGHGGLLRSVMADAVEATLGLLGRPVLRLGDLVGIGDPGVLLDPVKAALMPLSALALTLVGRILFLDRHEWRVRVERSVVALGLHALFALLYVTDVVLRPAGSTSGPVLYPAFYWDHVLLLSLLLVPLWVVMLRPSRAAAPLLSEGPRLRAERAWHSLTGLALFGLAVGWFATSHPPERIDGGRLILDEVHSQWHSALIDFNAHTTGRAAEESFHNFVHWSSCHLPVVVLSPEASAGGRHAAVWPGHRFDTALFEKLSERPSILVMKALTRALDDEEVALLRRWVAEGGSLLVMGDRGNAWSMNANANAILSPWGMRLRSDTAASISGLEVLSLRAQHAIHPAVRHLDEFLWSGGCSIDVRSPALPLVWSSATTFREEADLYGEGPLPDPRADPSDSFGPQVLVAGAEIGVGRVLVMGDASAFANPRFFTPGRRELLRGAFAWLLARPSFDGRFLVPLLALGICALLLGRGLVWRQATNVALLAVPFGLVLGCALGGLSNRFLSPDLPLAAPLQSAVLVDDGHDCLADWPRLTGQRLRSDRSMARFFHDLARADRFPAIHRGPRLDESSLSDAEMIVLVAGLRPYDETELDALEERVRQGAGLLLLGGLDPDRRLNLDGVARRFGLRLRPDPILSPGLQRSAYVAPSAVEGGTVLARVDGIPLVAYQRLGRGLCVAVADHLLFSASNRAYDEGVTAIVHRLTELLTPPDARSADALHELDWTRFETGSPSPSP